MPDPIPSDETTLRAHITSAELTRAELADLRASITRELPHHPHPNAPPLPICLAAAAMGRLYYITDIEPASVRGLVVAADVRVALSRWAARRPWPSGTPDGLKTWFAKSLTLKSALRPFAPRRDAERFASLRMLAAHRAPQCGFGRVECLRAASAQCTCGYVVCEACGPAHVEANTGRGVTHTIVQGVTVTAGGAEMLDAVNMADVARAHEDELLREVDLLRGVIRSFLDAHDARVMLATQPPVDLAGRELHAEFILRRDDAIGEMRRAIYGGAEHEPRAEVPACQP